MALPDLKNQIIRDSGLVFHNPRYLSEKMRLTYQGKTYSVWASFEEEGTSVRDKNNNQRKNDNEKALYQYDKYLWVRQSDMGGDIPKRERVILVNGLKYRIREVTVEFGEILITMRRLTE